MRAQSFSRLSRALVAILLVFVPSLASAAATFITDDITTDTRWTTGGSPYVVSFQSYEYPPRSLVVAVGATLTIDPGVVVKLGEYRDIKVRGTLRAEGAAGRPVIFTSLQDDTAGGDTNGDGDDTTPADEQWMHIEFLSGSSGFFDHSIVRYGGAFLPPVVMTGIANYGGTLVIDHTTLAHNGYDGFAQYGGRTTITNSLISDHVVGINFYGGELSISHSSISGNETGVDNQSQIIDYDENGNLYVSDPGIAIDARDNWWGDASGPRDPIGNATGLGNDVYGNVLYSPWLASDPLAPPDPCAAPGACASSVLFLPGMKGSVLKVNNDTVWPPSFWSDDLLELALTADGESVNPVVVNGILETFHGTPIYSGFTSFMDELVASGTTTEWKALPYDWRFSPERILADGVRTPAGTVDPIEEIKTLAANSETGKVAIVAHSMGGLLGKAIIKKLQDEGKEGLIDSFVMIGTPQLGTPQAAASLLHGDGEGIWAGLIVNAAMARKIAQNFQSTYDLLPSPRYFDGVAEPVITFDPGAAFTQAWRDYWGPAIDTYAEFFSFITGGGVTRIDPEFTQLWIPEILRTDLAEDARDFHNLYDTYTFPDSIRVVQVAGWGAPTVKAIKYKTRHFMQNYEPLFTIEGDNTVVYPSAVSSVDYETYFFNLEKYRKERVESIQHRNLLNAIPVQDVIRTLIKQEDISETSYLIQTKPNPTNVADQLVVSTHSPVILGAYDQSGRFSGINPNQDLEADVLSIAEDIPGSTFLSFGGSQYLFLPKDGSYSIAFRGTGSGTTDVDIENFANDTASLVATYSDISVTASTSVTFIMNSASPQDAHIQVDSNNDGQVDTYIAPDNQPLTLNELLTNLKTVIQNLAIKDKLKANLLKKVKNIEKKIAKQKNKKASKVIMNLEKQIIKKGEKKKLSDVEVAEIVRLLEQIENAL